MRPTGPRFPFRIPTRLTANLIGYLSLVPPHHPAAVAYIPSILILSILGTTGYSRLRRIPFPIRDRCPVVSKGGLFISLFGHSGRDRDAEREQGLFSSQVTPRAFHLRLRHQRLETTRSPIHRHSPIPIQLLAKHYVALMLLLVSMRLLGERDSQASNVNAYPSTLTGSPVWLFPIISFESACRRQSALRLVDLETRRC